jgi:hypothetical protein
VIQEVSSTISAVAVVVGLGMTVVQLHLLRRQLKDGQESSRAAELRAVNGMDARLQYLIEAPELRGHFYSNEALPSDSGVRNKVLMISEAYADTLDLGVESAAATHQSDVVASWTDYAQFILQNAPGVRLLVTEHPMWWPELKSLSGRPDSGVVEVTIERVADTGMLEAKPHDP